MSFSKPSTSSTFQEEYLDETMENYDQNEELDNTDHDETNVEDNADNTTNLRSELDDNDRKAIKHLCIQYNEMKEIMKNIDKALYEVKDALGIAKVVEPSVEIPIKTAEELQILDEECANNNLKSWFAKFRNCRITAFIDESLLLHYNWDGKNDRKKFSTFHNLNEAFFEIVKNDEIITYSDYETYMKNEIKKLHNVYYQHKHRAKQRKDIENVDNLSFNIKKDNSDTLGDSSTEFEDYSMINEENSIDSEETKTNMPEIIQNTSVNIKRVSLNGFTIKPKVTLPVKTTEDLEMLNQQCRESDLVLYFKKYRDLSIASIFSEKLLSEYNWNGVQNKKAFSLFNYLHETLFDAFQNDSMTDLAQYESFIRSELKKAHGRVHQRRQREKFKLLPMIKSEESESKRTRVSTSDNSFSYY